MGIAQYKHTGYCLWTTVPRGTFTEGWKPGNVLGNCLSDWGKKSLYSILGVTRLPYWVGDGAVANRIGGGGEKCLNKAIKSCFVLNTIL